MLKRFVQLSVAVSLFPAGFAAHGGPKHGILQPSAQLKSEQALRKTREKVLRLLGQASPPPSRPMDVSTSLDPSITNAAEMEQCLVSVCGPARENSASSDVYFDRVFKPSLSAKRTWDERFDSPLKESLRSQRESGLRMLEIQNEVLRSGVKINEKNPLRALFGFMTAMTAAAAKMSEFVSLAADQSNFLPNSEKIEAFLRTLPADQREGSRLVIMDVFVPMAQMNFQSTAGNPLAIRLKKLHGSKPAREALIQDAKHLLDTVKRIRSELGFVLSQLLIQSVEPDILERALRGEDLSATDSEAYMSTAMTVDMMGKVYDGGPFFRTWMNFPVDFESLRTKLVSEALTDRAMMSLKTVDTDQLAGRIADVCRNKLTASLDLGTSDLRIARGKKMIQQIKEAAKKVTRKFNVDPGLRALTDEKIDQISFAMPESSQLKLARLEKILREQRRSAENMAKVDWNSGEAREVALMIGLLAALGTNPSDPKMSLEESEMKKACDALPAGTLSDFSMTSLGNVSVSWFALNYPDVGSGVIAHEIGHVVSRILRSQRTTPTSDDVFMESLNCIANRNPNQPFAIRLFGFQDTVWSEEDWADHFSALVMSEMEAAGTLGFRTKNMACSLVDDMGDYYLSAQSIQPAKNDPHSSGLLRVLMVAFDQGKMTPQCQKLMDRFPQKKMPLTCH